MLLVPRELQRPASTLASVAAWAVGCHAAMGRYAVGRCPGAVLGCGLFSPLAFVSFFLFSDYIQIIASSKICASLK
jgi:hypothetical protein